MEAALVPQVQKRAYVNQTNGWLGVVILDPRGEEKGVSVEPNGTVWLSEAEVILTARAPRLPEDNPFEEQTFVGINAEGRREEFQMRPLVPADTDPRYVPTQERYVPPPAAVEAHTGGAEASARNEVEPSPESAAREAEIKASPPAQGAVTSPLAVPNAGPPSTGSQALTPEESDEEGKESWTEPPPAPGQVLSGALRGADGPPPEAEQAQAPDPSAAPPVASPPPQPPVPPAPPRAPEMTAEELAGDLRAPTPEEHAAVDPAIGEETGTARPPVQPAPEGEFAAAEEVGSPDAPAQSDDVEGG